MPAFPAGSANSKILLRAAAQLLLVFAHPLIVALSHHDQEHESAGVGPEAHLSELIHDFMLGHGLWVSLVPLDSLLSENDSFSQNYKIQSSAHCTLDTQTCLNLGMDPVLETYECF